MALLSMTDGSEATSITSSLSVEAIVLLAVLIIGGFAIAIIIWLVVGTINFLNEKQKYYQNLNKKLEQEK